MTNLEIIKSTYEGKTSEENGKNLATHVAENISWTEAKGFPYGGTYIGLDNITKNVFKISRYYKQNQIIQNLLKMILKHKNYF
mgnify:CR=1 FL=1